MNSAMTMRVAPKPFIGRNLMLLLLGLLLLGALLAAFAIAGPLIWSLLLAAVPTQLGAHPPLLVTLLQQQGIVISLGLSILALVCALFVRLAPLTWWLYLLTAFERHPDPALARTMTWVNAQQVQAQQTKAQQAALQAIDAQTFVLPPGSVPGAVPGSVPGTVPTAMSDAASTPGGIPPVPVAGQPPAAAAPGQAPTAPPVPGAPVAAAGQPAAPGVPPPAAQVPPAAPGAPPPATPDGQPAASTPPVPGQPQPVPTLQQALAPEESLNLAELTSVDDILSNAFNDDEEVDANLLRISQSLDEVDVTALVEQSQQIYEHLKELAIAQAVNHHD